jgi:hypothetical protein
MQESEFTGSVKKVQEKAVVRDKNIQISGILRVCEKGEATKQSERGKNEQAKKAFSRIH